MRFLLVAAMLLLSTVPALAWKPNTHVYAANQATSLIMNGTDSVQIDGVFYDVDPAIANAIRNHPEYYQAGVIGPDAFPDIYVGQSFIHPDTRGNNGQNAPNMGDGHSWTYEWLRHIYQAGWSFYNSSGGNDDGQRILAFTYGFLTHAAGDMWAHSFVNDVANGVFPSLSDISELPIGIRHIVVEAYVGQATPPTTVSLPNGSEVLKDFVMNNMVKHEAIGGFVDSNGKDAFELGRGAIFDWFYELRAEVVDAMDVLFPFTFVDPLAGTAYIYCIFWVDDIDDGLETWTFMSQQVATDLFVNSDFSAAKSTVLDFITPTLLEMIGVPTDIAIFADIFVNVLGLLGDIVQPLADEALLFANSMIAQHYGIDLLALADYILTPENHINEIAIGLSPNTSNQLDALMFRSPGQPFNPSSFAPMHNTIELSKLVLLSPSALNQVLYDHRVGPMYELNSTHNDFDNAMLGFIRTIDGHHQWRKATTISYLNSPSGTQMSEGMPLWSDCVSRDRVFRALFKDWQNLSATFPDFNEAAEEISDTPGPGSSYTINGAKYVNGPTTYVGNQTTFTVDVVGNYYWNTDEANAEGQITPGGTKKEELTTTTVGPIDGSDGPYTLNYQGIGLCSIATGHPQGVQTFDIVLDGTAPTITVPVPNQNQQYDVNVTFQFNMDSVDAGSGVATLTGTLDGTSIADLATVDTFFLTAGNHTFAVQSTDNIGNLADYTRIFRVSPTIAGLKSSVTRAYNMGLITNPTSRNALMAHLDGAQKALAKNQIGTVKNKIESARNLVAGQLGSGVQVAFGNRFIGWCNDLNSRL